MRSIGRLFGAVGTPADSLHDRASVVGTISGRLRQQLAHDEAPPGIAPRREHRRQRRQRQPFDKTQQPHKATA